MHENIKKKEKKENHLTISSLAVRIKMAPLMREKIKTMKIEHNFVEEIEAAKEKFCSEYNIPRDVAVMLLVTGARIGVEYLSESLGYSGEQS